MYVALSLTPRFSANSGIWPAPSSESFRTVSFADGQRSGGCCPTIRYWGKAPPFHRGTVGVGAFCARQRPDRLTPRLARQRRRQPPGPAFGNVTRSTELVPHACHDLACVNCAHSFAMAAVRL